jgi:prepilin-type processing-associated H-X9-DG protein
MAQIDALLSHMTTAGSTRARLRGDLPSELESASGVSQGNVIPNGNLETTLEEIAPIEAREALRSQGTADFQYNGFNFHVAIENGILSFNISPSSAAYITGSGSNSMLPPTTSHPETENNSGQGAASVLPPEAQGFNWGGFLLPWIWPLAHNTWIGLLSFIPIVGFFMRFFLGFKGNELAWQNRKFTSLDQFKNVQRIWLMSGLVVSLLGCTTFPITAAILFPVFARARENARRSSCQQNLKSIALATIIYTNRNNEAFPNTKSDEEFKKIVSNSVGTGSIEPFECPSETTKGTNDYVYNKKLAGLKLEDVKDPANTPMIWDKEGTNHLEGRNIAFADGHIKWYREEEAQALLLPYTTVGELPM